MGQNLLPCLGGEPSTNYDQKEIYELFFLMKIYLKNYFTNWIIARNMFINFGKFIDK